MKKFTTVLLALCILVSTSFIAPKSHALVGLILKSRVAKTIGGIGTGTGVVLAGGSLVAAITMNSIEGLVIGFIGIYAGAILGGVGLVILDDKTIADIEFVSLTPVTAPNFNADAIAVYNSELEELNAIRKTIQAETSDAKGYKESNTLWNIYKAGLSDETVAIAEFEAKSFMEAFNHAL